MSIYRGTLWFVGNEMERTERLRSTALTAPNSDDAFVLAHDAVHHPQAKAGSFSDFVVNNPSKRLARCSRGMPQPVSAMVRSTPFKSRLSMTCRNLIRITWHRDAKCKFPLHLDAGPPQYPAEDI